ncbi:hypothetical protein DQ04_00021300 [Trypanosoma grayi]|uniref:hypothetical protein n=1 Tax=Trypanosoma grayi TaxID=71804 RepID=UPI0004F4038A|nr:hypothetical protein DQ04_00021300 [Trypanosoma grayi]KEG15632.1 hypothetical protein DQ04_00021300 [Trypanosoma grayi]
MPPKVVCVHRGADDVANAFGLLDESQVQLLYTKFPVGNGTFRRNKFIYVMFIGPGCSVVKRGKGIAEINQFKNTLQGAAGITTTEKSSLSLSSLIQLMRKVFVTDTGNFSLEKIQEDYKHCIQEQQLKMQRDVVVPRKPAPQAVEEEEEEEMQSLASLQTAMLNSIPCEIDDNARKVLDALHTEFGPLNWATFDANPVHLTLVDAGNGGIFELVKHLPETKWLFGLFRITLGRGEQRLSRLIFFQWIGSKLKLVRHAPTTRIFPKMASILAPYEYEVYLVGTQDLKPQAIINKCRYAFGNHHLGEKAAEVTDGKLRDMKAGLRQTAFAFTEEEYSAALQEERSKMDLSFDFIRPKRRRASHVVANGQTNGNGGRIFETQETLQLIGQPEGGLMWGIFEVRG